MTDTPDAPPATPLFSLLDTVARDGAVDLPQGWTQGRTAFGGLSAALAYTVAQRVEDDLPPLRSAQVAFCGPLFGTLKAQAAMLRRGRSTAFVTADVTGDKGPGLHGTFVFAAPRDTDVAMAHIAAPDFPPDPWDQETHAGPPQFFTSNMDYVGRRLDLSVKTRRLTRWMRLRDRDGLDPVAELLCMGDSLPPSMMGLLDEKAMVSSMNWQINLIADAPQTRDGWWLIDSETHHAAGGASSQYMSMWNANRQCVATGMQSVAYYT